LAKDVMLPMIATRLKAAWIYVREFPTRLK
jgi:hypothetical protein